MSEQTPRKVSGIDTKQNCALILPPDLPEHLVLPVIRGRLELLASRLYRGTVMDGEAADVLMLIAEAIKEREQP
jgi:hypothetical protein